MSLNSKPQNKTPDSKKGPKRPKKITQSYLHNSGLYYLERYSASSGHFREVMQRKIKRSCAFHSDQNYDECIKMLDELVQKFLDLDLLDDRRYTRSFVNSLRRRGKSSKAIKAYLSAKRVSMDLITEILNEHTETHFENDGDAEYQTALTFARKKRLGPYRGDKEPEFEKELGKLARAGFSYDTARRVLSFEIDDYSSDSETSRLS